MYLSVFLLESGVSLDLGAMQQGFDAAACTAFVEEFWPARVLPALKDFVRVPNLSKFCDPAHLTNGHMQRAAKILLDWSLTAGVQGLTGGLVELPDKDPVLFFEIEATQIDPDVGTVLMYGHLDKQPPVDGWDEGLAPYDPVERDGYLYGRGGADDGYSLFAALAAVLAVQRQGASHGRILVLIEATEESGSPDLPFILEHLKSRLGVPNFIVCLDSGCGNYEQLFITSTLRGILMGDLHVATLTGGVHSGNGGGIVADTFRIATSLVGRATTA